MDLSTLPADLVAFLQVGPRSLDDTYYGEPIHLVALPDLGVETLELTPNVAPFARQDPHRYDGGYYAVSAVNLVGCDPDSSIDFAWLFLWFPDQRRYGSFDTDHGDLLLFATDVTWTDIVADPDAFLRAIERSGPLPTEYLQPWPRYPYILPDVSDTDKEWEE